ncbi:excinuclease ABC subunit A [candidate division WWE3 bacterium RIFCSPHIGHO2_01_FULL_40_23]|uniref:UvrABC system protein A n=1 Tax=candidate division WWE3 bacterium RIFCSPLOWO2_01_FULL_41_18 TaxID=1802625 RepID=A0A1F4VCH2_UNCKA|nr:MAG: excinuclease ABC subunit A [candidate division WWE3 bacterium RIFCSPHIGHO2_01_FULL_40_23]OGC54936.1 MAG: excinuclease ABC subunit A [candidate division WWE3 bacterium RIFCSPLOWO2_01_FULL_41_18]
MNALDKIVVKGARQHNLKNVSFEIPKNKLVVFTGVSGSGKSSMAMDTIYAEGQRRYVESLSAYARQFVGVMDKPDVESIEGLSPAIAIDQKTTSHNPRSTVGTVTEIYDFFRLLFSRAGHPHCPSCGREISQQSSEQIVDKIFELVPVGSRGIRLLVLSPIVKDRKGEYSTLFENLRREGYIKARIDGKIRNLNDDFELIKTNKHTIDLLIDRVVLTKARLKDFSLKKEITKRLTSSVDQGLKLGNGNIIVSEVKDASLDFPEFPKEFSDHLYSERFACPVCNISLPELEPRNFSFNSPHGACSSCDGLGNKLKVDPDVVLNQNLSIMEGGVFPWSRMIEGSSWMMRVVEAVSKQYDFSLNTPIKNLSDGVKKIILYGAPNEVFRVKYVSKDGENSGTFNSRFEGVIPNLERRYKETSSDYVRGEIERYMVKEPCSVCLGTRLKKEALSVTIDNFNISSVCSLSVSDVSLWVRNLKQQPALSENERKIAFPIIKEIDARLKFLLDVGLDYLTIDRSSASLAGGEAQRIRLASQIGSGLSGVLYVLDEPSIGLHQRDQGRLIDTLKNLRDLGNTVLVVEHDKETMLNSDYILDFGPGAGEHGGKIVAFGTPSEIKKNKSSLTGRYLSGEKEVGKEDFEVKSDSRLRFSYKEVKEQKFLEILGAKGHNLKNINVKIPLSKFVCVTGVSGSGKSTLVNETLYRALRSHFGLKNDEKPEGFDGLVGAEEIDNAIAIDQSPIGRTPKSNPATYTKTFDFIREVFSQTPEARVRGYAPGRFSFNVKGGRCEACLGEGQIRIEMQFMPDVYINCEVCGGKRYNREALEIYYKQKNISDILNMTVEEALSFFENIPQIRNKLETLYDVGLSYIKLGQPAPTLSGGEAQRVKLATELSKRSTGGTFYILDEPTTGLHFYDLERLIAILKRLVAKGNTILVIEHNLDVIKNADYVIDLGLEGGDKGGEVLYAGTLEGLLKNTKSHTASVLREEMKTKLFSNVKV